MGAIDKQDLDRYLTGDYGRRQYSVASIRLLGVGAVEAKFACEFREGESTIWNYGHIEKIISIRPRGKTQRIWTVQTKDGKEFNRFIKVDRLVGVWK